MIVQALAFLAAAAAEPAADPPRPQDDFFGHVNAEWLSETEIPPHVPWIGPFVENTLAIQGEVRGVIEDVVRDPDAFGPQGANIAAYWNSLVEPDPAANLQTLQAELEQLGPLNSAETVAAATCRLHQRHSDFDVNAILPGVTPVWLGVRALPDAPSRQSLYVEPSGLGLPDPAYYVEQRFASERSAYNVLAGALLHAVGVEISEDQQAAVLRLESELAAARLTEADRHDSALTLSLHSRNETATQFPWAAYFEGCGLAPDTWLVADAAYFDALANAIQRHSEETWRLYFALRIAARYAPVLTLRTNALHFSFYGETLLGAQTQRSAEDRAALALEAAFSSEIERYWLNYHFDLETRCEVSAMAETIRAAFAARLQATDLLSPQSRTEALEKLEALRIQVGHPDSYEGTGVGALSPIATVENLIALREAQFEKLIARANRPTDRDRWYAPAWDTSAYYVRSTNALALPAGLLRSPWYSPDASELRNLAGVGTVIAHEMGHAFDNQGSQFDAQGQLRDWWQPEDRARFDTEIEKLVAQYSAYEILPGANLNGRLTVSEAFADLAGLVVAHDALMASLSSASPEERAAATRSFLEANCEVKRALYSEPLLERILATEGHAPQQVRCNGPVSAFAPFYQVYDVDPEDGMHLGEDARASPW